MVQSLGDIKVYGFIGSPIGYTRKGKPVYLVAGGADDEEGVQGPTTDTDTGSVEPQESAAPWAHYVEPLPDSVRPLVEPIFKQWDSDVTKRFQTYSQNQAKYEPWNPIIEQYGTPDQAQAAFQLMQAINENPEQVYQALVEEFGFGDQGGSEPEDSDTGDEDPLDPRVQQYAQMTEQMAEIMLAQQQAEAQAQEDAELERYMGELTTKYGEFDNEYVLAHMNLGYTGEQAVEKYQKMLEQYVSKAPAASAPVVLGAGGGLPSQAVDPGKLNSKDTRSLVAQMLAAQAAES